MPSSPPYDAALDARLRLIVDSYRRLTGQALIDAVPTETAALREALWQAPRAIVAHGTEADPLFFYGNHYALACFEMSFEQFTRLPSRCSAESMLQAAREHLLAEVAQRGFVSGYSGVRIAHSGRRFQIRDTTVWNLQDASGHYDGQAAVFVAEDR